MRAGRRVLSFPLTIAVHKCSTVWEPLYFSINYRVHTGHAKPAKSKNLIVRPGKFWKIIVLSDLILGFSRQGQCKIERKNQKVQMTHTLVDARVFVCETKRVFEFLKLTVKPMVLENWKGSWNLMSSKKCEP